jgi:putative Mn2+ efflux pump MntP
MKLLKTKIWSWCDIGLLKLSMLLFGMIVGAYFHDFVMQYVWVILIAAVLLVIRPTIAYFKD